jgi:hypothetical protein
MGLIRWIGLMAIVGATSSARADILVWRDSTGTSHYTNDLESVPPEYRNDAMTVAKDWARALPPPEPVPAAVPAVAAMPAAATGDGRVVREAYDAAYAAGRRAASEDDEGMPVTNVGTVVQTVQVEPSTPTVVDRLVPAPVVVERRGAPRLLSETDARDARSNFPPAPRPAFIQGPGGPPPIAEQR